MNTMTTKASRMTARQFSKLTSSLTFTLESRHLESAMAKDEKLANSTVESLERVLLDAASWGLSLSPTQRLLYPLTYWNKKLGKYEAQATPSYMGLIQAVTRSGNVRSVSTGIVREGDYFRQWTDDGGKHIQHEVSTKHSEVDKVTHVYCLAKMRDGSLDVEVMEWADIEACKNQAAKQNGGSVPPVWSGPFRHEQFKKCAVRRAWKRWPRDDKLAEVMTLQDKAEPMVFEAEAVVALSKAQLKELEQRIRSGGVDDAVKIRRWLAGLANAMGYARIEQVPADLQPQLVERIDHRLKAIADKPKEEQPHV